MLTSRYTKRRVPIKRVTPLYRRPISRIYNRRQRIMAGTSRVEIKSFDQNVVGNASLATIGNVVYDIPTNAFAGMCCFNLITAGTAFYNRVGAKILMSSLQLFFNLVAPDTETYSIVRCIIIYDRQSNGAAPAIGDVLLDNGSGTQFNSKLNIANKNRFLILRDQYYSIDPAQKIQQHVKLFLRMNLATQYKASNGTIADISSGSLLFICAQQPQTAGAHIVGIGDIQARVRYYDF